ncbi:MAG TPA: thioredoxin domain-containing protein [Ferruginibacter sp.]|nr:thioredoxin domain-containing protein [Ferruginibacter sp.]
MATLALTKEGFTDKIFDFENETEWKFKGPLPAIIDFYADWCGPCRSIAPTLEALSNEYKGKIDIYKIDTEKETELSAMFGIQSIPMFLFIPIKGSPMVQTGALPKSAFKQIIEEKLLTTGWNEKIATTE